MKRNDGNSKREYIGSYLDTSKTRLKDYEADLLIEFINNYDETYKGKINWKEKCFNGWSSDGKYTRCQIVETLFTDDIGLEVTESYHGDDTQTGSYTKKVNDARGILNYLKNK